MGADAHEYHERVERRRVGRINARLDARVRQTIQFTLNYCSDSTENKQDTTLTMSLKLVSFAILDYFDGVRPLFK